MEKVFVVGGMGAGKSTVCGILVDIAGKEGAELVDLDKVGHEVLEIPLVKEALAREFGGEVLGTDGQVDRAALAARAFASAEATRALNAITRPHIEARYRQLASCAKQRGCCVLVVEFSAFEQREGSLAADADVVIAITAPLEQRVARAVARGWEESDVRRRIARQISDEQRAAESDIVLCNDGDEHALRAKLLAWWESR